MLPLSPPLECNFQEGRDIDLLSAESSVLMTALATLKALNKYLPDE